MNKARRHELKMLKYKKRLARRGALNTETLANPRGARYNYTGYRSSGKPCSCFLCRADKYHRARVKRESLRYE